ncbi:carbohydrate ABC transporter permease [Thermatribacter velox]|uniref:Carbohydrate ABC transporter permease n=1 Tax=Thermatribacter velox TaxID=3039681 RepID=A0ABZ2YAQ6_9BACT
MKRTKHYVKLPSYVVLIVAILFFIFPIYWAVATSFKEAKLAFSESPVWLFKTRFENYKVVIFERNLPRFLINSVIVTLLSTLLTLALGVCVGYSIAIRKIKGGNQIASWILSLRMVPPIVTAVPIYLIARRLNLLDTHLVLILVYAFMNLPVASWLIKSYFEDIPLELEEAAIVDGCTYSQALVKIILPLASPGIAATGVICAIFAWNEFLYANILTGNVANTAPVALTAYATPVGILWGEIFAAGSLIMLPVIVAGLALQRYLVRGLTLGALKE